jgi:hypothetical protein
VAALSAVLITPTASAAGQHWGTISAKDKTGNVLAEANGDFANNGGVYATVGANYRDMRNDDRPVYVEVSFYFWEVPTTSTEAQWVDAEDTQQTSRYSGGKWSGAPISTRLHPGSDRARAVIKVCEDVPSHTDPCSPDVTVTFNY